MDFYEIFTGMVFASVIFIVIQNYLNIGVIREPKEKMSPALATLHEDGYIHAIVPENINESFDTSIAIARIKIRLVRKIPLEDFQTLTVADTKRAKRTLRILVIISIILAIMGLMSAWNVLPPEWEIPVPTPQIMK